MSTPSSKGIAAEVHLILRRGRQVWRLVPGKHKLGLAFAGGIMAVVSLCNVTVSLLLGQLVDVVMRGTKEEWSHAVSYTAAVKVLGLIGGAYVLREVLNVARRY